MIEFKNLTKIFPGVKALDEVSFRIAPGQVHGLVGENGAGKSTLIKILAGALRADGGEMLVGGKTFQPRNPREAIQAGIATIYQERSYLPDRSVLFNIMLGRESAKPGARLDFSEMKKQCQKVLKLLHSETIPLDAKARSLKAGQRQILEIARALVQKSRVLILDEPSSALNQEERSALFQVIRTLKSQGLTVIYVSHRLEEIFQLADRVTVLRDGKHIKTVATKDTSKDELINAMVGRQWSAAFPAKSPELGEPILEAENLSSQAFQQVSFQLRQGEVLGITGLAGSGKEELAQALFGAYPVSQGRVKLHGQELRLNPESALRAGLAYLPEDRKLEGVISGLSVRRNISLPVLDKLANRFGQIIRRKENALAKDWVRQLDINTPGIEQLCENLSGGNQQKVALAKWLAAEAKVIILANPTQEVDVKVKFELYRFISELSQQGISFLLISSDLEEIIGLSHRILVMREGKIKAELDGERAEGEQILRISLGENK